MVSGHFLLWPLRRRPSSQEAAWVYLHNGLSQELLLLSFQAQGLGSLERLGLELEACHLLIEIQGCFLSYSHLTLQRLSLEALSLLFVPHWFHPFTELGQRQLRFRKDLR